MFSRLASPAFRLLSTTATSANASLAMRLVESTISENPVTVFSKTTCPFCSATKSLFATKYPNIRAKIIELDELENGPSIQSYLAQKTGLQTVPNVFVHSEHIGGNDSTQVAFKSGKLSAMLKV